MSSSYESKETWTGLRRRNYDFFEKWLKDEPKDQVLIDLGSGPEQFRDLTWKFKHTSVDFKQYGTTTVVADITKPLPFDDECADIVFLSNVLEHIPWTLDVLAECYRILRPGGMIIGTVPFLVGIHHEPHDYHRYTHFMLELLLEKSGFSVSALEPLGGPVQTYTAAMDAFFKALKRVKVSDSVFLQRVSDRFFRAGRFASRAVLALFLPVARRIEPDLLAANGYGFVGRKG